MTLNKNKSQIQLQKKFDPLSIEEFKAMPLVTVEQIIRFREAALAAIAERDLKIKELIKQIEEQEQ